MEQGKRRRTTPPNQIDGHDGDKRRCTWSDYEFEKPAEQLKRVAGLIPGQKVFVRWRITCEIDDDDSRTSNVATDDAEGLVSQDKEETTDTQRGSSRPVWWPGFVSSEPLRKGGHRRGADYNTLHSNSQALISSTKSQLFSRDDDSFSSQSNSSRKPKSSNAPDLTKANGESESTHLDHSGASQVSSNPNYMDSQFTSNLQHIRLPEIPIPSPFSATEQPGRQPIERTPTDHVLTEPQPIENCPQPIENCPQPTEKPPNVMIAAEVKPLSLQHADMCPYETVHAGLYVWEIKYTSFEEFKAETCPVVFLNDSFVAHPSYDNGETPLPFCSSEQQTKEWIPRNEVTSVIDEEDGPITLGEILEEQKRLDAEQGDDECATAEQFVLNEISHLPVSQQSEIAHKCRSFLDDCKEFFKHLVATKGESYVVNRADITRFFADVRRKHTENEGCV